MNVTFTLRAHREMSGVRYQVSGMSGARQLAAGVDIAEVIDLACPSFEAARVTNLRPPDGLRLINDGECTFVRALLVGRAVALAGNVLLVGNAIHPDFPVASAHF